MGQKRKLGTRVLCLLLAVVTLWGAGPRARAADPIIERIKGVMADHPDGSYFTVNGKACSGHDAWGTCNNCELNRIASAEGIPWTKDNGSWTCLAFARYVFQRVFGIPTNVRNNLTLVAKGAPGKATFQKALAGDILYCYDSASSSGAKHFAVVVGWDDQGAYIYQNNANGTKNRIGTVTYGYISYENMKRNYTWGYVKIYRSVNYADVAGQTVPETAPVTIVNEVEDNVYFSQSAYVYATFHKPAGSSMTQSGLILTGGGINTTHTDDISVKNSATTVPSTYQTYTELGVILKPETTYTYQFFVVVDGVTYKGEPVTFTTPAKQQPIEPTEPVTPACTLTCQVYVDGTYAYSFEESMEEWVGISYYTVPEEEGCVLSSVRMGDTELELSESRTVVVIPNPGKDSTLCFYYQTVKPQRGDMANFRQEKTYTPGMFWDVGSDAWYYENVKQAYRLGLMEGASSSRFRPQANITLGEVVTLAARLHKQYWTGSDEFTASSGQAWYTPYVTYAKQAGILEEDYDYTAYATREEFVHILARALPEEELSAISETGYRDASSIRWRDDAQLLTSAGVITGVREQGALWFKPQNQITRAEVAAIMTRMALPQLRVAGT